MKSFAVAFIVFAFAASGAELLPKVMPSWLTPYPGANAEGGSATEEVAAEYGSTPIEIGFNARYLLDISGQLENGIAHFLLSDAGSPTMVRDEDDPSALYVLMPMRV